MAQLADRTAGLAGVVVMVLSALLVASPASASPTSASPTSASPTSASPASASASVASHSHPAARPQRPPWLVTITIRTVPELPAVRFTVDGTTVVTDDRGIAAYTAEHNFDKHALALVDTSVDRPDRRYRFVRWAGQRDPNQAFRPEVNGLPMRANYTLTAAFAVQYPVTARFVDQRGQPVDPQRVSAVKVKDARGQLLDLARTGGTWLDGTVPTYSKSAIHINDVSYTLHSVVVDGATVVDPGRQRFTPGDAREVTFGLEFHSMTITAHDALFHRPIGTTAVVTFPGGAVRTFPLTRDRSVTLEGLPRGRYIVEVKAGKGIVFPEEFPLSRTRTVDVRVVSRANLAVVGTGGAGLAVGLLLIGAARWRRVLAEPVVRRIRLLRALRTLRRLAREAAAT